MQLTSEQVREICFGDHEDFDIVEEIGGEARRWSSTDVVIAKHIETGKYYELTWENGLTEMQENEFYAQDAPEVKKITKTIETTSWENV